MTEERNLRSNTAEDVEQGVKTGIEAARSARKASSTFAKAASGNLAGAAIDVITDRNIRQGIVFVLLFTFFLIFCCLFLAPMTIYESIIGYIKELKEEWSIRYYSGSSGRFVSFLKATAGLIGSRFQEAWDRVVGSRIDETDTDVPEDSDLGVIGIKADLISTYSRKIRACKEKIEARQEELFTLIKTERVMAGSPTVSGILSWKFEQQYLHKYDDYNDGHNIYEVVYDGFSWAKLSSSVSDKDALKLLCLHTVQKDMSLKQSELSGFMKWLGYNGGGPRLLEFKLGENDIWYQTKAWKGGFMPQYLADESNQRESVSYESNSCAVTDLLLQIQCPNLYSLQGSEREEIIPDLIEVDDTTRPIYREVQDGSIYRRDERPADYYANWNKNGWGYVRNTYCEGSFGDWLYQRSGWSLIKNSDGQYELYRKAGNEPGQREFLGYEKKLVDVDRHVFHVTFVVPVSVSCRPISEMLELAGFWKGFLPGTQRVLENVEISNRESFEVVG